MIILIIISSLLFIYSIIVSIGIIKAMKKTEMYENLFKGIKQKVNDTYAQIKEVDTLGAFEADDDVGSTFTDILSIVEELNNYTIDNIKENMNE